MLEHGGNILEASRRYGVPADVWLDLSTGINPIGWPASDVLRSVWARLPEDNDGLEEAARRHYGAEHVLPVAGTQAAIQALPRLMSPAHVGVAHPAYAEHAHAWRQAGHEVGVWQSLEEAAAFDVAIVINPNNPTAARHDADSLLTLHAALRARGGTLVVDEAFIDTTPTASLAAHSHREGLIVLRSLGKFYGLAGARVGFVLAAPAFLERLHGHLGPWTIPGPSRWIARQALADAAWQEMTRARLAVASQRLAAMLTAAGLTPDGGTALFQWVKTPHASALHDWLARRGILTRLFRDPPGLRFGLPGGEADWSRLGAALRRLVP